MKRALALSDKTKDQPLCVACYEKRLRDHEFPRLALVTTHYRAVAGDKVCPQCQKPMANPSAVEAAERLADWLEGG